jgi:hypothetical protein
MYDPEKGSINIKWAFLFHDHTEYRRCSLSVMQTAYRETEIYQDKLNAFFSLFAYCDQCESYTEVE